jgi:hypothetical protein
MRLSANRLAKQRRIAGTMSILLGFGLLFSGTANAQSNTLNPTLNDKWMFYAGAFFPSADTEVRLDSDVGLPGDNVNFADFLGLSDNDGVFWGGFRWRISRRNQLEVEFANLTTDGFNSFSSEDIDLGDFTVRAGAELSTDFRLSLARITYGFSVLRKEKHDLALKVGVHLLNTKLDIVAKGDIQDVDTGTTLCSPSPCTKSVGTDEFSFPLPHFGISYDYAISPKWSLRTQVLGFAITINDITGSLVELDLDLRFQPWKYFGFGAGWRYFKATVEDEDNGFFRGKFEYEYSGPALYFIGNF